MMAKIYYHASHEQFPPSELLDYAIQAQSSGFEGVSCSDHFRPWSERQGHSGFSFAWLGAAMQATTLPFGVVCAPGQRYHPAIIAQAAATLAEMFPNRFWMALGSGEALNETIVGGWPDKGIRNERLYESALAIKRLLGGETVTTDGRVKMHGAKLYSLPARLPTLIGAAISTETAEWLGTWADGLITIHQSPELLNKVIDAFNGGGGLHKPKYLKVQLSYDKDYDRALKGAYDQWRTNVIAKDKIDALYKPADFDKAAEAVTLTEIEDNVHIICSPSGLSKLIDHYDEMGFDIIILHNVNKSQRGFLDAFLNAHK